MSSYMIVEYSEVTDEMISVCLNCTRETLRHSKSGTDKVILEWIGDKPECLPEGETYNEDEIYALVETSEEWR